MVAATDQGPHYINGIPVYDPTKGLYLKQVNEVEDARQIVRVWEEWEGEFEYWFLDPIKNNDHIGFSDYVQNELRTLEKPLFAMFEADRELTNPTPEEILMMVES